MFFPLLLSERNIREMISFSSNKLPIQYYAIIKCNRCNWFYFNSSFDLFSTWIAKFPVRALGNSESKRTLQHLLSLRSLWGQNLGLHSFNYFDIILNHTLNKTPFIQLLCYGFWLQQNFKEKYLVEFTLGLKC